MSKYSSLNFDLKNALNFSEEKIKNLTYDDIREPKKIDIFHFKDEDFSYESIKMLPNQIILMICRNRLIFLYENPLKIIYEISFKQFQIKDCIIINDNYLITYKKNIRIWKLIYDNNLTKIKGYKFSQLLNNKKEIKGIIKSEDKKLYMIEENKIKIYEFNNELLQLITIIENLKTLNLSSFLLFNENVLFILNYLELSIWNSTTYEEIKPGFDLYINNYRDQKKDVLKKINEDLFLCFTDSDLRIINYKEKKIKKSTFVNSIVEDIFIGTKGLFFLVITTDYQSDCSIFYVKFYNQDLIEEIPLIYILHYKIPLYLKTKNETIISLEDNNLKYWVYKNL